MLTHPQTAPPQSSKRYPNLAAKMILNFFPWSAALIMTRCLSHASLPSPCCSFPAATGTDTVLTSLRTRMIWVEERSCSPRRSQLYRAELKVVELSCCDRFANPGVTGLDRGIDEIAAF